MSRSPRLSLPFVMAAQAQKHVTVNESLRRLDILVQTAVVSASRMDEPAASKDGEAFILPAGAGGPAWSEMATGSLAVLQDGVFEEIVPRPGHIAFVEEDGELLVFAGTDGWMPLRGPQAITQLGVNTEADARNRLAVKSDAVLFTHDDITPGSGDALQVVNKRAAGNTAALLFQNGYSGRAELGLLANDSFSVKVSANGSVFTEALRVDPASGHAYLQPRRGSLRVGADTAPACTLDVAGPVRVAAYLVAALPRAAAGAGQIVFVPNEAGGPTLAFSDGTQWRRVQDRLVVSAAG